jgi:hypothetical protein
MNNLCKFFRVYFKSIYQNVFKGSLSLSHWAINFALNANENNW